MVTVHHAGHGGPIAVRCATAGTFGPTRRTASGVD